MKKSIPKHQHYVPQMLLRRFADEDGKLYFFSKRFAQKGVLTSTPGAIFHERHLYSTEDKEGVRDVTLELDYVDLEGRADQVIEKIVVAARNSEEPHLTIQERQIWDDFFLVQWKRVPDFHERFIKGEGSERLFKAAKAKLRARRQLTPEENRDLEDPAWIERIKQNAKVDALAKASPPMRAVLSQKGLGIAIIRKPTKSFVVGSFPVLKLTNPGRENISDPTAEIWLPVAYDVAVSPAPVRLRPLEERLIELDDRNVRHINFGVFKQSTAVAGRSRELIVSLSHSH
jgi:hypothetical protein